MTVLPSPWVPGPPGAGAQSRGMTLTQARPTFADTTSAIEAENLTCQICGLAPKSQALSMSFSLSAVWFDGTIVANNPLNYVDPWGWAPYPFPSVYSNGSIGLSNPFTGAPSSYALTSGQQEQVAGAIGTIGAAGALSEGGVGIFVVGEFNFANAAAFGSGLIGVAQAAGSTQGRSFSPTTLAVAALFGTAADAFGNGGLSNLGLSIPDTISSVEKAIAATFAGKDNNSRGSICQ